MTPESGRSYAVNVRPKREIGLTETRRPPRGAGGASNPRPQTSPVASTGRRRTEIDRAVKTLPSSCDQVTADRHDNELAQRPRASLSAGSVQWAGAIRMGTLPVISLVETSLAVQVITRSAGMGPWNCPFGITAMGVPIPAAERRRGCCGKERCYARVADEVGRASRLCGVPAAAAVGPVLSRTRSTPISRSAVTRTPSANSKHSPPPTPCASGHTSN